MKILILVCSSHEHPYDKFLQAQKETWDSIPHPNIETVFYHGSGNNEWDGNVFKSDCPHGYWTQQWKHKQALDACWDKDWDMVFRTHSSSYVDKYKLYELCKNLSLNMLYGGWLLAQELPLMPWSGKIIKQNFISGAGQFYSRDVADILRHEIPKWHNIEEDVLSGRIMQWIGHEVNFINRDRVDLQSISNYRPSYHYRIKTNDRMNDIKTMYELHKLITA